MTNKSLHNKKRLIEALENSLGVVTDACRIAEVSRVTFYDYYKNDSEFKKQVDDISNIAVDYAETELYKRIKSGDTTAIIFYLKTRGKSRGYIEKSEIEHNVNIPSLPNIIIK